MNKNKSNKSNNSIINMMFPDIIQNLHKFNVICSEFVTQRFLLNGKITCEDLSIVFDNLIHGITQLHGITQSTKKSAFKIKCSNKVI